MGLVGRICVVLIAAITLVFFANAIFYGAAEKYIVDDVRIAQLGEDLTTNVRVLSAAPVSQRSFLAVMLSGGGISVAWQPLAGSMPDLPSQRSALLRRLKDKLTKNYPILLQAKLDLYTLTPRAVDVFGSECLPDGSYIHFRVPDLLGQRHFTRGLASAGIAAAAIVVAAIMLVRGLGAPLRALAAGADRIGSNEAWVPLDEYGPREVRGVARAINAVQSRIQNLLDDRTQALAAVSHDLKTPLTRLRLRSDFLEDAETQAAIATDLDEMEAMITTLLAYFSGVDDPEKPHAINIVATLNTLIDEQADRGRDALYQGPSRSLILVRPVAMKRVLSNLIENALNYGGNVRAGLTVLPDETTEIIIEDNGPGIPESAYEKVLTPFYRLEGSRSRSTGGIGLGLAIVHREIQREGGTIRLERGEAGTNYTGLKVTITLPASCKVCDNTPL
ncbi:ATP-binding protein [Swingsia samuiensis]|uniref:ATP-binding protein n=1 Tax=Swingsia samuiensis TaxID=1293412 RepID=UPI001FE40646|nr:ATP-binding protein [Swingsia samuiensis]